MDIDELNSLNTASPENLSKCCKCNDAPGDFILDSCMHNLCNYCIATCLEMRDMYNCPKCFTKSKISANIYLPILNRQSVERCSWCEVGNEESIATGYCSECDIHLCPECIRGHCRMPQFRSHHVQLNTDADGQTFRNCDSHPNEALDIYCETCEKLTCRDCQLSLHKEHKHQWIGEKAREMQSSLLALKDQLSDRLEKMQDCSSRLDENRQQLTDNVDQVRTDMVAFESELVRCQRLYFEGLETKLDLEINARQHQLEDVGRNVARCSEILQHCSQLLHKVSSSREHSLLIQVTPKFLSLVSGILSRCETDQQACEPCLATEFSDTRFQAHRRPADVVTETVAGLRFGSSVSDEQPSDDVKVKLEHVTVSSVYGENGTSAVTSTESVVMPINGLETAGDLGQWPLMRKFCCVCNDGGFVVCCSGCQRLYHQACHVPRLAQLPASGEWLCTGCHCSRTPGPLVDMAAPIGRTRLSKRERRVVAGIFLELLRFHDWTIFTFSGEDGDLNGSLRPQLGMRNGTAIDLDKIRFNIENKVYNSIVRFIEDLRLVFTQTAERNNSPGIQLRVFKFQEKLNSLLKEYIIQN